MRYIHACECGGWHLVVWPKGTPEDRRRVRYRCRSWRHSGPCREWKGAQDFARIREALDTRNDWTYLVLTFAQREWPDPLLQYVEGFRMWSKVRLRLRRKYGDIRYIQTWERHAKGGAHVNVLIANRPIYEWVKADRYLWRREVLEPLVVACGFGKRTWIEPLREGSEGSMAGYLVKLARELTGAGNKDQIPWDAPPHFRRIRASRGLLPPVRRSELTGRMVFAPISAFIRE
jgi:hypothetical protein